MSFSKAFRTAIGRSVDVAKNSTAAILRMDVTPSAGSRGPLALWQITTPDEVADFATGSDKDLGGLSSVKLDLVQGSPGKTAIFEHKDESQHQATETTKATQTKYQPEPSHHGRFFGTLSNQVPRGAALERSGYAAFRNRNRPTLFGAQTWDVSLYRYLAFRVRNNAALPSSATADTSHFPSLSDLLTRSKLTLAQRARSALGYGVNEGEGPKYFVNIQTDGPVTSDLFQHRLWLNPSKVNEWQTVVISLDAFLLLNAGTVSMAQVAMLSEGIKTVGISAVLESPQLPPAAKKHIDQSQGVVTSTTTEKDTTAATEEDQQGRRDDDGEVASSSSSSPASLARGSKRGVTHRFDLAVAGVHAVGSVEEGMDLWA